jgi:hypothetical protein
MREWCFSKGKAGRCDQCGGFYWWFWLPNFHWNHGLPRDVCTDVAVNWFCFWCSLTIYWR